MSLLDVDPQELFETHSVSDIEQVRVKIRQEIEKKKEELRVMVGERYRDLIDAADSISNMTVLSQGVITDVHEISSKCSNTRSSTINPSPQPSITPVDYFAAQIKLLIDLNQQIWMCLDERNVLLATIFYQFAFFIKTNVDIEVPHSKLLGVQWKTMVHFQHTIIKNCEKLLLELTPSGTQTCECILSLALLENLNTQELLDRYLELRSKAIQKSFTPTEDSAIAKENIINSYDILLNSISCIYENFHSSTGFLWTHGDSKFQTPVLKLMQADESMLRNSKHLPNIVHSYKMNSIALNKVDLESVGSKILTWLSNMKREVEVGVESSLKFVLSLKLVQDIHNSASKVPDNFPMVINELCLPNSLNMWNEMYQVLIIDKAKHLISIKWGQSFDSVHAEVLRAVKSCNSEKNKESELDLRWYTWKESNSDLDVHEKKPSSLTSSSTSTSGLFHSISGLLLKSHGFTPRVVSVSNSIQARISTLDKDLQAVDQLNINQVLTKHQMACCEKSVAKLVSFLLEQINSEGVSQSTCVLIARISSCLTQFCPALQHILNTSTDSTLEPSPSWNQVVALLLSCNHKAWDQYIVLAKPHYFAMFSKLNTANMTMTYVLQSLAQWETVTIEETTESGAIQESSIQVPTQPGLLLQESLLRFTSNLSRLSPSLYLRQNLTQEVLNYVLTKFTPLNESSALSSKQLVQRMNIQSLFDVRYIANVLVTNQSKSITPAISEKVSELEKSIDVFDLEIIRPYLSENIDKCVGKTQCLLGVKSSHAHSSNSHVTMTSSNASSVIPISKDVPWFPLLALSNTGQSSLVPLGVGGAKKAGKSASTLPTSDLGSSLSASAKSTFFSVTEWFG